jgi:hypothetical protein
MDGERAVPEGGSAVGAGRTLTLSGIWENSVALAYTSETWDEPCAGKVLMVKYPQTDNTGYVGRTWDVADGGILGGEGFSVQHKGCAVGGYKNEKTVFHYCNGVCHRKRKRR